MYIGVLAHMEHINTCIASRRNRLPGAYQLDNYFDANLLFVYLTRQFLRSF